MTVDAGYIAARTRHFTGRDWVFEALDRWLADDAGPTTFVLTGGPGTGKTAIAARLVQMDRGEAAAPHPALGRGWLAYAHLCQTGVEDTLSPSAFVQGLSEALATRYPPFRQALEAAGSTRIVINAEQTIGEVGAGAQVANVSIGQVTVSVGAGDAKPLFDTAVRRPLQVLARTLAASDRVTILIDSLDEALAFSRDSNIVQLLGAGLGFPPSVRFIVTCRSNSAAVFDIVGRPTLDLIADAPSDLDEVRPYLEARLQALPAVQRATVVSHIAAKSAGNFLYAHHVVEDLLARGADAVEATIADLPSTLDDVYRRSLERGLGRNMARWNDAYRPILGAVAVARGDGFTRDQLIEITGLAEDTADDVLVVCAQFLLGGGGRPYRLYHQSFREFLLDDEKFGVFPAERHAAVARYLQERCGGNWSRCTDDYALRYTPAHWAEAAALSAARREARVQTLIGLVADRRYQQRFETRVADLPLLHGHVHRAVDVAALSDRDDMLPTLVTAARTFVGFRREYLRSDSVATLAEAGRLDAAQGRLPLFADVDEHWQMVARAILAWLALEPNRAAAIDVRDAMMRGVAAPDPVPLLVARFGAAIDGAPVFGATQAQPPTIAMGREMVRRISGQEFDSEMLTGAINPSMLLPIVWDGGLENRTGFAANFDAPMLVSLAVHEPVAGTQLVDEYIDAHAGYNYVEYRNKSLWFVLAAVLRHHPDQQWVRDRLRRLVVTALSGGGVEYEEMLPLTTATLAERAAGMAGPAMTPFRKTLMVPAMPGHDRDSWSSRRRRLSALMELTDLVLHDRAAAEALRQLEPSLPQGFAGFQAPARLRFADALRACRLDQGGAVAAALELALRSAHHIQDYHFCARVTSRCNAMTRWHQRPLVGDELGAVVARLARTPGDAEFATDHVVGEAFVHRPVSPDMLPVTIVTEARTLEQLVDIFQRSAVEFARVNSERSLAEPLAVGTPVRVPDPGFAPLLAVHLSARVLADPVVGDERVALIRSLVPVAAVNPTALDTILSYLLIATDVQESALLEEIAGVAGPPTLVDAAVPAAQIGPDAALPV